MAFKDALEVQSVRGDFHHSEATTRRYGLSNCPLDIDGLRRCHPGLSFLFADGRRDRSHPQRKGVFSQDVVNEVGRGGFSVRSRNSDKVQLRRGISIEEVRTSRHEAAD